ncbi:uncharacterized protein BJ171DRAFT_515224 [Polychytrium aggregatum]|uniref:uncharacterized protein n=1 Tax=Polychytrium aggregatum TaxID=110093 RepID=UPI0022FF4492|nr:uncharacterized protein BJ171DRAFT_515224 [Polychytrium aggregatum]KAI9202221.1 hypothetical protein BJ171DRAFT_515224 [Polychytrium aggregatum]
MKSDGTLFLGYNKKIPPIGSAVEAKLNSLLEEEADSDEGNDKATTDESQPSSWTRSESFATPESRSASAKSTQDHASSSSVNTNREASSSARSTAASVSFEKSLSFGDSPLRDPSMSPDRGSLQFVDLAILPPSAELPSDEDSTRAAPSPLQQATMSSASLPETQEPPTQAGEPSKPHPVAPTTVLPEAQPEIHTPQRHMIPLTMQDVINSECVRVTGAKKIVRMKWKVMYPVWKPQSLERI